METRGTQETRGSRMDDQVRRAVRLSATGGYRGLSDVEKAVKMCKEDGISERAAKEVFQVSNGQIYRGKKAYESRRQMGLPGRPKLLPPEYEAELVRQIDEAEGLQQHLTLEETKSRVCISYLLFPTLSTLSHIHFHTIG